MGLGSPARRSIDWHPPASDATVKFKLDENLPHRAARTFVEANTVYDEDIAGQRDEDVLAAAVSEDRVLVTGDVDFSDSAPTRWHALRDRRSPPLDDSRAATQAALTTLLSPATSGRLRGALTIVTPS